MLRIIESAKKHILRRFVVDPVSDIQVLCPMNRGGIGARSLNINLQAALNPASNQKVERFGWTFTPDDKVMQIENDYAKEVYNGDIGYINAVGAGTSELRDNFDGAPSSLVSANSTRWCRPMPRRSIRARDPNIRRSSFRSSHSIT